MSTNFYFHIIIDEDVISHNEELNDFLMGQVVTRLHIGKRSAGWLPLFEETEFYSSVKELEEFYERNKGHLVIEDEYGWDMSFEELREDLIEWDGGLAAEGKPRTHGEVMSIFRDDEGYEFVGWEFS